MNRLLLTTSLALAGALVALPATAATLEYTFTVPFEIKSGPTGVGVTGVGAGAATLSMTCAVGPASLGYSTATGSATNATGSGTTNNVRTSPAIVVVTVDAEPRGGATTKGGAGGVLQPTSENGYYTCWAKFAGGQTPVNFLPTTAMPKVGATQGTGSFNLQTNAGH
jgi:hypothetical protein